MCSGHFNQHFQKQLALKALGGVSNFPAIVFTSWRSLTSADLQGPEVKGKRREMETKPSLCSVTSPSPGSRVPPAHVEQGAEEPLTRQDESAKPREQTALTSPFQVATSALVMLPWQRPAPADPKLQNEATLCLNVSQ